MLILIFKLRTYNKGFILLEIATTRRIKLIEKKEFVVRAFDLKYKIFVIHIAILSIDLGNEMHLLRKA